MIKEKESNLLNKINIVNAVIISISITFFFDFDVIYNFTSSSIYYKDI
jgi:hypothetical protein